VTGIRQSSKSRPPVDIRLSSYELSALIRRTSMASETRSGSVAALVAVIENPSIENAET